MRLFSGSFSFEITAYILMYSMYVERFVLCFGLCVFACPCGYTLFSSFRGRGLTLYRPLICRGRQIDNVSWRIMTCHDVSWHIWQNHSFLSQSDDVQSVNMPVYNAVMSCVDILIVKSFNNDVIHCHSRSHDAHGFCVIAPRGFVLCRLCAESPSLQHT